MKNVQVIKYADQFESGEVVYENESFYVSVEGEGRFPYKEVDDDGVIWEREADTITEDVWEKIKETYPEIMQESDPINHYVTNYALNNKWFDMYTQDGTHLDCVFEQITYDENGEILASEIESFHDSYDTNNKE